MIRRNFDAIRLERYRRRGRHCCRHRCRSGAVPVLLLLLLQAGDLRSKNTFRTRIGCEMQYSHPIGVFENKADDRIRARRASLRQHSVDLRWPCSFVCSSCNLFFSVSVCFGICAEQQLKGLEAILDDFGPVFLKKSSLTDKEGRGWRAGTV